MWKKIDKYYQTLKYLKKSQIRYLIKNRLERGKKAVVNVQAPSCECLELWMDGLDAQKEYLQRFHLEEILGGKVTLLYESKEPCGRNWVNSEKSHLWNFNLHYLEYLIPLAAAYRTHKDIRYYECFRDYCQRWIADNREGTGDGWHPYTISLRLTNLWICLDGFGKVALKDATFLQELNDSMYAQYLHLQKKLERHLLGNHYFENLKAVLLGAVYFKEPKIYKQYKKLLQEEIQEQILADGVHYERSLMYHKIILEDLMRIAKAVCQIDKGLYKKILVVIQKMADAMCSLEKGLGRTPLFNDAGDNVARPMSSLLLTLENEFQIVPKEKQVFAQAGYYCLSGQGLKVVLDAGEIAPDYMAGHGHCDGLSFELAYNGHLVFVNSGTGQYQGQYRSYFRSTAAHNTVVIDGKEQSQCWGEHRVARRISKVSGSCGKNWVKGTLTTWTGKRQERILSVSECEKMHERDRLSSIQECPVKGCQLQICDNVQGHAQAYFHLAPEYRYVWKEHKILVESCSKKDDSYQVICEIETMPEDKCKIHRKGTICSYAPEFGKIQKIQVLEIQWDGNDKDHIIQMKFS